ncbi:DUF3592 domain-containing protein [Gracilibacillus salinarum]|uniref:DUF3592 domain-containing protein n=1 Tax=Gracilibacillus salinarum TaxID=2932255 RepID=A0ABY4GK58_9BACI|nr:DUF3592 domain-containing protein [Gracilibacillus salinarum]UOQ84609.1 DUF3592 domain-containing protein [Gracilibacillus salinarum]
MSSTELGVLVTGMLSLIFGFYSLIKVILFLNNAKVAKGTIKDIKWEPPRRGYFPVITYLDEYDQIKTFESHIGFDKYKYKIGQSVEIRYNNQKSVINSFLLVWFEVILFIGLGLMFSVSVLVQHYFDIPNISM